MQSFENHGRSCTSMVALGNSTATGATIYAKNSDRPVNEAQPMCFFPAKDYPEGAEVKCTFICVPQVKHTYACIGSKPSVFFGFEHGINEYGVIIGNEQVSGKEIPELQWGLIGMDILRLALERSKTAEEAVGIIGNLLETYGTGGDPNTRIPQFNSNFIIADAKDAYLFESHQRSWVAKKVDSVGYLSNCYSIEEYDFIGDNVTEEAIKKGWLKEGQNFNPAKAWTIDDCVFGESEGFVRYARLNKLMKRKTSLTLKNMMNNLRDHYDGEVLGQTIFSPVSSKIPTICSHPGGLSGCASAASVVAEIRSDVPRELRFTYWGSMAPPCCSIFRPFYNIDWLPEDLQKAASLYDDKSQWWLFIELERYIALSYDELSPVVKEEFNIKENEFIEESKHIEKTYSGDISVLKEFTSRTCIESTNLARKHLDKIKKSMSIIDIDNMLLRYFVGSSNGCNMSFNENIIK